MNKNNEATFIDYVALTVVVGSTIFGAYHLGKLGKDWAVEGIRVIKDKTSKK